jgi:carboxymethylenebutenolidase
MTLHVDYYVSLNSPWTHLGAARIVAMTARHGATLRIHPVDFGTIFAASGGLPLPKRAPQRQAYRLQELARWRDALGIPIHIQPRFFPAREQPGASAVIAVREEIGHAQAIALAHGILKALWEEERDTGDLATLEDIVGAVGLDPEDVMEMAADPKWAERRAADSEAALARGVFGAPTYVIGDDIFWGQDRLDFVERRLAAG